jgi:hypothetical protein
MTLQAHGGFLITFNIDCAIIYLCQDVCQVIACRLLKIASEKVASDMLSHLILTVVL